MKKLIITSLLAIFAVGQTQAYLPVGYATCNGGTTGGGDATPTTVTTLSEFKAALPNNAKNKVVYVSGNITMDACYKPSGWTNITIYGLPGSSLSAKGYEKAESGILYLSNASNVIIQNLTFKGSGAYDCDGYDNLCLQGCTNVWVDHCDFQDGTDGNFDIIRESDYVSVTYCKFQYLIDPIAGGIGGTDDHRFTNLIGNSDDRTEDKGKLRVTYQYCWWAEGCKERMPRIRFGQVHLVNNLFDSSVANYCVRAAYQSDVYVDKNAFIGVKNPVTENKDKGISQEFNCTFVDNYTSGTSGTDSADEIYALDGYQGAATNPYAAYCEAMSTIDASEVQAKVKANAGATLTSDAPEIGGSLPTLECTTNNIDQTVTIGNAITTITFSAGATATSIAATGLPNGLTANVSGLTLSISGTPTESGTYTVTASDAAGESVSISGTITLNDASTVSDFWNFSDDAFNALGTLSGETTVNGLTMIPGTKGISITSVNATCDGYTFTHALQFSGGGSTSNCTVKFDVTGTCVITVYGISTGNDERTLRLATESETMQDNTVPTKTSAAAKLTYTYTGSGTTLYLFSAGSGINIFGIKLSYPVGTDMPMHAETSLRYLNGKIQNPDNADMVLYNISGQCLTRTRGNIDMRAYPAGIYIVRTAAGESLKVIHGSY